MFAQGARQKYVRALPHGCRVAFLFVCVSACACVLVPCVRVCSFRACVSVPYYPPVLSFCLRCFLHSFFPPTLPVCTHPDWWERGKAGRLVIYITEILHSTSDWQQHASTSSSTRIRMSISSGSFEHCSQNHWAFDFLDRILSAPGVQLNPNIHRLRHLCQYHHHPAAKLRQSVFCVLAHTHKQSNTLRPQEVVI